MSETKARSRLKKKEKASFARSRLKLNQKKLPNEKILKKNNNFLIIKSLFKSKPWQFLSHQLQERIKYSLSLIISLILYYLLYLSASNFYPEQLQDFILENSFLPVLTVLFLANFFFFSFLFLKQKPAIILSFYINIFLLFRLQKINWDMTAFLFTTLSAVVLGLILYLPIQKNLKIKKKIKVL